MSSEAEDRTEPATPEKLRRARREGQVANSRDLVGSAAFAAGLWGAHAGLASMTSRWAAWVEQIGRAPGASDAIANALRAGLDLLSLTVWPVAALACLGALLAAVPQVGLQIAPKAVTPRLDRVSPKSGVQRLFSRDRAFELGKNLAKMTVAGGAAAWLTRDRIGELALLGRADLAHGVAIAVDSIRAYAVHLTVWFVLIGVADAAWSRQSFARRMRMSKREVKREQIDSEGDPLQKGARRELARELLMTGRVADVKKAAVVVVNPVHFAVALEYGGPGGGRRAPTVLAKGRSAGARAIREAALRARIPIVENPPLARALHELALGDEIPEELWDAVADVLALLFAAPHVDSASPTLSGA